MLARGLWLGRDVGRRHRIAAPGTRVESNVKYEKNLRPAQYREFFVNGQGSLVFYLHRPPRGP
ncbi:hypothetical protein SAMD00023353_2500290 [Rosellinia necatrix]|uniref:Uncharacterized protein n=1 Tax=Rosellinia necatrix TaxID=77044 RepID=A0A1S8A931_ROSNE|nr:hypothetical protein SAMD00023353_2500290 [Rosellinia necatrix]